MAAIVGYWRHWDDGGREVDGGGVVHTRADLDPSSHAYEVRGDGEDRTLVLDGPVLGAREFASVSRRG